jgi:two-component system OmpR family response regulator
MNASLRSPARKKKVLIVDDQPHFADLLGRAMPEFEVRVESDSLAALSVAREFQPDVFLLDLVMPEMDGALLAANIRNDRRLRNTPIVFLSGMVDSSEDAEEPVLIDGTPAFGKPFNIPALERFISTQCAGHSAMVASTRRLKKGVLAGR